MNARTLKRRLDGLTGADRPPPRVALFLPPNGRDLPSDPAYDVVRIFDPTREKAARKAGLSEREAHEAARMTDAEIQASNALGDEPGVILDPTADVSETEPTP